MTKASEKLPDTCPKCQQEPIWLWRRFKNAGGHTTYPYVCSECGYKSPIIESKQVIVNYIMQYGYSVEDIPEIKNENVPVCEICGEPGAELHHYAPRHIFGDDAENWPKGYLCVSHHQEWHKKIRSHK